MVCSHGTEIPSKANHREMKGTLLPPNRVELILYEKLSHPLMGRSKDSANRNKLKGNLSQTKEFNINVQIITHKNPLYANILGLQLSVVI